MRVVTGVSAQKGKLLGKLTIHASGGQIEVDGVANQTLDALRSVILSAQADAAAPAQTPASPSESVTDQLAKLGQLRDSGVLTQEEFESKKAELLARL